MNISTKLDSHGRICMFLGYSEDHTQKVYRFLNLNTKRLCTVEMYSMDIMYGEHTGIKCKSTINEDYSTDEEASEEEDPVQLNMKEAKLSEKEQTDETKINKPEKSVTSKDKIEMPPGETRNLEWTANTHPGIENIVGHIRSEDISMKENLNWCTMEQDLSDNCLMMAVNSVNPNELKTFAEAGHHPDPMQQENWQKAIRKEFSSMIK